MQQSCQAPRARHARQPLAISSGGALEGDMFGLPYSSSCLAGWVVVSQRTAKSVELMRRTCRRLLPASDSQERWIETSKVPDEDAGDGSSREVRHAERLALVR